MFKWLFSREYRYFYKMFKGTQNMIWNNEFKRFKLSVDREKVRQEYDSDAIKLSVIEAELKSFPEDKSKWTDEQKRLEDKKTLLVQAIDGVRNGDGSIARPGHKDRMRDLDLEINGSKKTNEFPEGIQGISQDLDGLRELRLLVKKYLKSL